MSVSVYKHNPTGAVLVVLVLVLLIISEEEDAGPRSRGNHLAQTEGSFVRTKEEEEEFNGS